MELLHKLLTEQTITDSYHTEILSKNRNPFKRHRFPLRAILLAVRWLCRYPLSYRDVRDWLMERGIHVAASKSSPQPSTAGSSNSVLSLQPGQENSTNPCLQFAFRLVSISHHGCTPIIQQSFPELKHEILNLCLYANLQQLLCSTLE